MGWVLDREQERRRGSGLPRASEGSWRAEAPDGGKSFLMFLLYLTIRSPSALHSPALVKGPVRRRRPKVVDDARGA